MKLVDKGGYYVAENAVVIGRVKIDPGVSIWYGAVVRADMDAITIGAHTNIQDGCVLHCDPGKPLSIGSYVTVLSVDVDAWFRFPAPSVATSAPIVTMTVPMDDIPLTEIAYVVPPPVTTATFAPAVPERVTSVSSKPVTDSSNTTV